jgi:hypothetical protein
LRWRFALDNDGDFLGAWVEETATLRLTPSGLFEVASGLVWQLQAQRVEVLGGEHARLGDGRILERK